jgi:hypothetical protein
MLARFASSIAKIESADKLRDALVGMMGVTVTATLEGWKSGATIFCGTATGLWMVTQIVLAILKHFKKPPPPEK